MILRPGQRDRGRVYMKKSSDCKELKDITTTRLLLKEPESSTSKIPQSIPLSPLPATAQSKPPCLVWTTVVTEGMLWSRRGWSTCRGWKILLSLLKVKEYECNSSDLVAGSDAPLVWTIQEQEVVKMLKGLLNCSFWLSDNLDDVGQATVMPWFFWFTFLWT